MYNAAHGHEGNPSLLVPLFGFDPPPQTKHPSTTFTSRELSATPRPDVLQDAMLRLVHAYPDQKVTWKISKGLDNARQVIFQAANTDAALSLKTELDKAFVEKGCVIQGACVDKQLEPRLTYYFVDPKSADTALASQSAVDCAIIPPGSSRQILDRYIVTNHGANTVAFSRTELYGDVYCVVLKDWDVTYRFIRDPFKASEDMKPCLRSPPLPNPFSSTTSTQRVRQPTPHTSPWGALPSTPFGDPTAKNAS
ncbi:hypothetical protein R3P38DRAFT_3206467 [Favolaschia claudopus]|uniref:Uncharacterized protein n=1 Tax=Favolaschia claudopus TaxID=2862362 RepID=A0AAW0AM04_9AGAR